MMCTYKKLLRYETKTSIISLVTMSVLLVVFWGMGLALFGFAKDVPNVLEKYISVIVSGQEFDVELSWLNEERLIKASEIVEKEGLDLINVEGERNHISAEIVIEDYYLCEKLIQQLLEEGIQVYSELFEIIKPIYDDIIFFEQIFFGMTIVMTIAFITILYSGINMVLASRRKYVYMLQMLGYSRSSIRWIYNHIFDLCIIIVFPLAVFFGQFYERYTSDKLMSLFGSNYKFGTQKESMIIAAIIFGMFSLCLNRIFVSSFEWDKRKKTIADCGKEFM